MLSSVLWGRGWRLGQSMSPPEALSQHTIVSCVLAYLCLSSLNKQVSETHC